MLMMCRKKLKKERMVFIGDAEEMAKRVMLVPAAGLGLKMKFAGSVSQGPIHTMERNNFRFAV